MDIAALLVLPSALKMETTRFGGFGLAFTLSGGLKRGGSTQLAARAQLTSS